MKLAFWIWLAASLPCGAHGGRAQGKRAAAGAGRTAAALPVQQAAAGSADSQIEEGQGRQEAPAHQKSTFSDSHRRRPSALLTYTLVNSGAAVANGR